MSALRLLSELLDELECGDWKPTEFACLMLIADGRQTSQALQAKFKLSENQMQKILARVGAPQEARARVREALGDHPGPGDLGDLESVQDVSHALHVLQGSQDSQIIPRDVALTNVMIQVPPQDLNQDLKDSRQDSQVPRETRARKYNQRKQRAKKEPDEAKKRAQELKHAIAEALFKPPFERKHWALANKLYRRLSEECGAEFSLDKWREYVQDWQVRGLGALSVSVVLGVQSGYAAWLVRPRAAQQSAQSARQMHVVVENGVRRIVYA